MIQARIREIVTESNNRGPFGPSNWNENNSNPLLKTLFEGKSGERAYLSSLYKKQSARCLFWESLMHKEGGGSLLLVPWKTKQTNDGTRKALCRGSQKAGKEPQFYTSKSSKRAS